MMFFGHGLQSAVRVAHAYPRMPHLSLYRRALLMEKYTDINLLSLSLRLWSRSAGCPEDWKRLTGS